MNFIEAEGGDYCEKEEEEEEEEDEEEEVSTSKLLFSSPYSSSSSSSTKHTSFVPPQQQPSNPQCHQPFDHHSNNKNVDLIMDLSLRHNNEISDNSAGTGAGGSGSGGASGLGSGSGSVVEKEHMFDKVVTPSDVGKLNRLVIPKQHAEKYFPLDSSSNEKGLLLNFEDRNGKPWRFRYSYWNSSQSYVMTKGWSRFVKEKKLDAGDIVSFQRGVGESGRHRLFIDWRRRPNAPDPSSFTHLDFQNQMHFPPSMRWASRLYSLPQSLPSMPRHYEQHPQLNQLYQQQFPNNHRYYYHHNNPPPHQQQQQYLVTGYGNVQPPPPQYYLRPAGGIVTGTVHHQQAGGDHRHHHHMPMVIDSVPVVDGKSVGKRLRLFGVNMECPIQDDHHVEYSSSSSSSGTTIIPHGSATMGSSSFSPHLSSSPLAPPFQLSAPMPTMQAEFSKKGKSSSGTTSLSFDLDL